MRKKATNSVAKAAVQAMPAGSSPEELVDDYTPCLLGGTMYRLKCSWAALKVAALELRRQGIQVNLMAGLDFRFVGPDMVAPLFFAMAFAQHPSLQYKTIDDALDLDNALVALDAVATAYVLGMPQREKGDKANPSEVQAQL